MDTAAAARVATGVGILSENSTSKQPQTTSNGLTDAEARLLAELRAAGYALVEGTLDYRGRSWRSQRVIKRAV